MTRRHQPPKLTAEIAHATYANRRLAVCPRVLPVCPPVQRLPCYPPRVFTAFATTELQREQQHATRIRRRRRTRRAARPAGRLPVLPDLARGGLRPRQVRGPQPSSRAEPA